MSVFPPSSGRTMTQALAPNRLGVAAMFFFAMSAAAPLTVTTGIVPTGFAVTGLTSLPASFLVVGLVLAIFSVGFVTMARHVENAGAFYAYIARGLTRPAGIGGAYVALIAYNLLQVGLYGAIGAIGAPLVSDLINYDLQWWVLALLAWFITAGLGVRKVDVNGRVLAVLLLAEIAVILLFSIVGVLHPDGGTVTGETLDPTGLLQGGIGAALALGMLGFVGFEAPTVYAEEARNPRRTVMAAVFVSIAVIAGLYAFSSWSLTVAVGTGNIVAASAEQGPGVVFGVAAQHLGPAWATLGQWLTVSSILAGMIAFHNTTARYAFALGREEVAPRWLGRTNRFGAPQAASLAQSGLGLAVIILYAATGWDPLVKLFFWCGTAGGIGVLLLVTATSYAVIVFFARHRGIGGGITSRFVFPAIGAVLLTLISGVALLNLDVLLGVTADDPLRYAVPIVYAVFAVLGVATGLLLRARRPGIYARIGMGAKALTTRTARHSDDGDQHTGDVAREVVR